MAHSWSDLGGGYYAQPELSLEARSVAAKKSKFFDILTSAGDVALGKNHGETVVCKQWGRITHDATNALSEYSPIPFATVPEYTRTATVYERGVGVTYTGQREMLDRLGIEDPIIHALNDHSSRTHNELIYDAAVAGRSFCYTPLSATSGNFTTNGSPTGTAAAAYNGYHAREVPTQLQKYNTPFFDGENYVCVGSPTFMKGLYNDTTAVSGFVDVKKYTSGADGALNGEVGTYFGVRYVVDNDIMNSYDAIGSGSAFGSALFFGLDGVIEIPVMPMELRMNKNISNDFGRQAGVAWMSLLGYLVTWVYATQGQGTICHYTTA